MLHASWTLLLLLGGLLQLVGAVIDGKLAISGTAVFTSNALAVISRCVRGLPTQPQQANPSAACLGLARLHQAQSMIAHYPL